MKKLFIMSILIVGIFALGACGDDSITPSADGVDNTTGYENTTILIAAAASLTEPIMEVAELYKSEGLGTVTFTFGASGSLLEQIANGAGIDGFISASTAYMDDAVARGLVAEEDVTPIFNNKLIVGINEKSSLEINSMDDLYLANYISIGEPSSVPAGDYAKTAMTSADVWDDLEAKMVYASDVTQAVAYVEAGAADICFSYATDLSGRAGVVLAFEVPEDLYNAIIYPMGIVSDSSCSEDVARFFEYLLTNEAAIAIFEEAGFSLVD